MIDDGLGFSLFPGAPPSSDPAAMRKPRDMISKLSNGPLQGAEAAASDDQEYAHDAVGTKLALAVSAIGVSDFPHQRNNTPSQR
jgi:hypothetical protein